MRVKTDSRRLAIIHAAWEVFRQHGLQGASMSEISERVGGSKATLYGYFKSKDELFVATLKEVLRDSLEESFGRLTGEGDLRERLLGFARPYARTRLDPDLIAVQRAMIAEADRSEAPKLLHDEFFQPNIARIARVLEQEMEAGRLRRSDPARACAHLRSLIAADLLDRRMHGETFTKAQIEVEVQAGVDAFLRIYAPETGQ